MTLPSYPLDFSLHSYEETLKAYRKAGYEATHFAGFLDDPREKHLILRHDIDNDLELAARVARLEARAGCTASYFVRVHARGYNLLSLPSLRTIRELEALGHEVQLHLEGGLCDVVGGDNLEWAERQRSVFEAAVGRQLTGFSSHEPARMGGVEFADSLLARWSPTVRYHAYESRFMMPTMKYLSDSSGRWREGHFGDWVGREPIMQILTHPFWWFEQVPAENY
ncbi:GCN5 family acetyltransferase [Leucobacter ruminantium]|uniref:GCN5 family acetyltransferase n=1 Tax=Leucobacter ruminantium TaxID=1289170 RepID=A0A939M0T4_9MICO|nr:GCN5 family acetyltransferase [Leucobacter ruminantium]MBO1806488.1 GCN5 family acetyltransferase [Leucobacter ruminantium]